MLLNYAKFVLSLSARGELLEIEACAGSVINFAFENMR